MNESRNNPRVSFALLGSGRVARHLQFYLNDLGLPVRGWSRGAGAPNFADVMQSASHVLLAVSDGAIAELAAQALPRQTVVHFSGALTIPRAHAAHPLMTFGERLERPDWYRQIPFVIDEGTDLAQLLPGLPNTAYALKPEQRAYYHSLCALAGNSTFLLWQQIGDEFEARLNLPRNLLSPFLHQVVRNAGAAEPGNFTGPVARKDWETVRRHLNSLSARPNLLQVYRQYLELAAHHGHPVPEALL